MADEEQQTSEDTSEPQQMLESEETSELALDGVNLLQEAVIAGKLSALRLYVWMGVFADMDVTVNNPLSPYAGKDILEIAEYNGLEDMVNEVSRCRKWEASLSSLQRIIRQSRGSDAVSAILFDTSEDKLLKVDSEGYSTIHWAAVAGDREFFRKVDSVYRRTTFVEWMLIPTSNDGNALQLAAELGHSALVGQLLTVFYADLTSGDNEMLNYEVFGVVVNSLLDITARNGDTDTLRLITETFGSPPQRLLGAAVENNRHKYVRELVTTYKLDPDDATSEPPRYPGWPLRTACLFGQENLVYTLAALSNSNPTLTNDKDRRNCIHWAAVNGSDKVMKVLLTVLSSRNILQTMINSPDIYMRDSPIILVRGKDDKGEPVWHYVLVKRNREHLLANSATMKIGEFGTILKSGSGSDPDEETVDYITDAMNGKMTLDKSEADCTPLHVALAEQHYDCAKSLISAGANINARDFFGMTSLHYAVKAESVTMCEYILQHGADFNIQDCDGQTAADLARAKELDDIVNIFTALTAS